MAGEKQQTSSGGVIFRENPDGVVEVALIARRNASIWCLPKGLIEDSETPEETALRETREETGLDSRILEKIGEISYNFYSREDKSRVEKRVHFFLQQYIGGDEKNHDWEVDEVRWYPLEKALEILKYENERLIMKRAAELIGEKYTKR